MGRVAWSGAALAGLAGAVAVAAGPGGPPGSGDALDLARRLARGGALEAALVPRAPWQASPGGTLSAGSIASSSLRASAPATADGAFELGSGGSRVSLTTRGAAPSAAALRDGRVVYAGVFPSTDALVVAAPTKMEALYLLRDEAAPSSIAYDVELGPDLRGARLTASGALGFSGDDARVRLEVAPPFAVDARGVVRDASLAWDGAARRLTVTLDPEGLEYPLLLDPTVTAMTADWTLASGGTAPLDGGVLAYDSARDRTVLYDGGSDTWEWDGAIWTHVATSGPSPRTSMAMTYDAAHKVTLLFGGSTNFADDRDTWAWDGKSWTQVASTGPLPRGRASLSFDSGRRVVVLFGGSSGRESTFYQDTWEWDGTTWTEVCTDPACQANLPAPRDAATMTYDLTARQSLLFGGTVRAGADLADLWAWDGTAWTALCTAAPCSNSIPPGRHDAGFVFDPRFDGSFLFGGDGATDLWVWESGGWRQASNRLGPPPSSGPLLYDSALKKLVYVTTSPARPDWTGTWTYDGALWAQVPVSSPVPRPTPTMAYDAAAGNTVLFGGCTLAECSDTWTWNGKAWTLLAPASAPPPRWQASMTYDSVRQVVALFGGLAASDNLNDLWLWSGSDWTHACTSRPCSDLVPASRHASEMAFDPVRSEVVLFGGYSCGNTECMQVADTWTWNGSTWAERTPPESPPGRQSAAMAFDAAEGKIVLFGGLGGGTQSELADTWEWDGATWTERTPAVSPPAREQHSMVYDPVTETVVLFGGSQVGAELSDVWAWDGSAWTEQTQGAPTPGGRTGVALTYDTGRSRLVAYGGASGTGSVLLGDTWELAFQGGSCSGNSACETGHCVDGACCASAGCATCQACAPGSGVCVAILGGNDPGSCEGTHACSAAGVCLLQNGQGCSSAAACASGFCVDGVCCNSGCNGQCQACDAPDSAGTCAAVAGPPHGERLACPSGPQGDPCAGLACDGTVSDGCTTFVGKGTACGEASCLDGLLTSPGTCDGQGSCLAPSSSCLGFACDPSGSGCLTSCASNGDCVLGALCDEVSHQCSKAAVCDGQHTVIAPDGVTRTDCSPYTCEGTVCRTSCGSALDCVAPDVCDLSGHCVTLPADTSFGGCSAAGDRTGGRDGWAGGLLGLLGAWGGRARRRRLARRSGRIGPRT